MKKRRSDNARRLVKLPSRDGSVVMCGSIAGGRLHGAYRTPEERGDVVGEARPALVLLVATAAFMAALTSGLTALRPLFALQCIVSLPLGPSRLRTIGLGTIGRGTIS